MPDIGAISRSIFERLWREATPNESPPGLFPPAPASFERRSLARPEAALARLAERFSADELLAAGVAAHDDDGGLVLAPALRGERIEIIALRENENAEPYDLLTSRGCLCAASPAAMSADYRWRRRAGVSDGYVYLAFSWGDFLWLEEAGLPSLYCPSPEQLGVALARSLAAGMSAALSAIGGPPPTCAAAAAADPLADGAQGRGEVEPADNHCQSGPDAGTRSPGDENSAGETAASGTEGGDTSGGGGHGAAGGVSPPAASPPAQPERAARCDDGDPLLAEAHDLRGDSRCAIIFVVSTPGAGSAGEAPGLCDAIRALAQVEQALGDAFIAAELIVWAPASEELARLDAIRRYGDLEQLQQSFRESVESFGRMLSASLVEPPPKNFIEARAAYRRVLLGAGRGESDAVEQRAIQSLYDQHLQRQLIEPILQLGADSPNPRERARCAVAAEICDHVHRLAPLVAVELDGLAARGGSLANTLSRGGGMKVFLDAAKTLAQILEGSD